MNNQNDLLSTVHNDIVEQKYKVIELLKIDREIPIYDIVLHIRLEDFINKIND